MFLLFSFTRRQLALLLVCALAGCQSPRTAYRFQPATRAAAPQEKTSAPAPLAVLAKELPPATQLPATTAPQPKPRPAGRHQVRAHWRQAKALANQLRPAADVVARPATAPLLKRQSARHRGALPAAGIAENGLGTMFLGILGIVALLVGLIGLLLGGGGFFGLLAAGGAVALLVSIVVPMLMGWGG